MISLDRMNEMLNEIADRIPPELYGRLNGGVALLPDCKRDEQDDTLYIMGEYCYDHMMGRRILIYGGSFQRLFGDRSEAYLKKELEKTLKHELTHHVESLAGERDLEIQDEIEREAYKRKREQ